MKTALKAVAAGALGMTLLAAGCGLGRASADPAPAPAPPAAAAPAPAPAGTQWTPVAPGTPNPFDAAAAAGGAPAQPGPVQEIPLGAYPEGTYEIVKTVTGSWQITPGKYESTGESGYALITKTVDGEIGESGYRIVFVNGHTVVQIKAAEVGKFIRLAGTDWTPAK